MTERILCLIIDATPEPAWAETYEVHRRAWGRLLDVSRAVDGYFLYSDPGLENDWELTGRRFVRRGDERADTILQKTVKAIDVLLGTHDYVVRTNVSSLWDFPLLLRSKLPKDGLYTGALVEGGEYVTGSGIVLSPDVARKLYCPVVGVVSPWDDRAIGQILRAQGIHPVHRDWCAFDYERGLEQIRVGEHAHYRLRELGDPERKREREVTEHVLSILTEAISHGA